MSHMLVRLKNTSFQITGRNAHEKGLNVGGNSKTISLPPQYADFEHILLDIDPKGSPDIVCDARDLEELEAGQFDAVYCSHNLEHYYRHEVKRVLAGFLHVLKDGAGLPKSGYQTSMK